MRGRLLVALGLIALVGGALLTVRLTQFPTAPLWAVAATAFVGLVTTLVTEALSSRVEAATSRKAGLVRHCLSDDSGAIPRIDKVKDLLVLGVRSVSGPGGRRMTAYVPRDADPRVDDAIRAGGLVIAEGPAGAGRTRTMYEAVRRVYPGRLLLAPRDPAALTELLNMGIPYRTSVVWLDRLERFIEHDGLDLYTLMRRTPDGRKPGVVVGTLDSPAATLSGRNPQLSGEVLQQAVRVSIATAWSRAELDRARASLDHDPILAAALREVDLTSATVDVLHYLASPTTTAGGPPSLASIGAAPRCLGREADVAEIATALCAPQPRPTCVLGPPGIGKTTVIRAALHDSRVAQRFARRRYLIRCDGSRSVDAILAELGVALGIPIGADLLARVTENLSAAAALVVLDNIGEPWETDPQHVEEFLGVLAGIPDLALVVSLRGSVAPFGVTWGCLVRISRLDHAVSKKLFLAVVGDGFANDPHLGDLVAAQDGVPLAIELLAFTAQAEPDLAGLWRRWTVRRGGLMGDDSTGYHRLDASFELSIESVRMNATALRLLSSLSHLPDGLNVEDLDKVMPGTGDAGAATLRRVGLAYDDQGRLRMLGPVRDFVARTRPPAAADRARLVDHFVELATRLGSSVGADATGAAAGARLVAEGGNLDATLRLALDSDDPAPAIRSVCALGEFNRYTGMGEIPMLEEAASASQRIHSPLLEGECRYRLGDIALRTSRSDDAMRHLRAALPLFEQAGDRTWAAHCVKHIGDVAFELNDFPTAAEHFERATVAYQEVGDRRGEANCLKCLGDVAMRRSDYTLARQAYEEALGMLVDLGNGLGQADCLRRLADSDVALGNWDSAGQRYDAAIRIYEPMGAVQGFAHSLLGKAWLALGTGDLAAVADNVHRAAPLFERFNHVRGNALCIQTLGRLALAQHEPEGAEVQFRCALELFESVGDVIGAADCELQLSNVVSSLDEAREHAQAALRGYRLVGRSEGVSQAGERLVDITRLGGQ